MIFLELHYAFSIYHISISKNTVFSYKFKNLRVLFCHFTLPHFHSCHPMFYFCMCLKPRVKPLSSFLLQSQLKFFIIDFIFLEQCLLHSKTERKVQRFSMCPRWDMQSPPLLPSSMFVAIYEPTLTRHCRPETVGYTRFHS